MSSEKRDFLQAINETAELGWGRCPREPSDRLPVLVWRFADYPANKVREVQAIDVIRAVMAEPNRDVAWHLYHNGRNWVLEPDKFRELRQSTKREDGKEWEEYLEQDDPGFCRRAHADLERLVEELVKHLPANRTSSTPDQH